MKHLKLHNVIPKHKRVLDSKTHRLPHYIYPQEQMQKIQITHQTPKTFADYFALYNVKVFRTMYDFFTRYNLQNMTEKRWMNRCIFLQTIAGVPGMVGGMIRHLETLRVFKKDKGFIHHLFEQADNERFHLFMFLHLRQPGKIMRMFILLGQGVFMTWFGVCYFISRKFGHRFVGYLQEQAVKTYTAMIKDIDRQGSHINRWKYIEAPQQAIDYYHLGKNATMRDLVLCIRADESTHRGTNHLLAEVNDQYEMQEENIEKEQGQIKKDQKK